MRNPNRDTVLALALDCGSGAASPAETLLAIAGAEMNPALRTDVRLADAVGGALLETGPAAPTTPRPQTYRGRKPDMAAALAAVRLARSNPEAIAWRRPLPHVRTLAFGVAGARLVRLDEGDGLPAHDHDSDELTLVLRGAFKDDLGVYEPGDIACAGLGDVHAPHALSDCVCLIASAGRMRFRSLVAETAYRLLWR